MVSLSDGDEAADKTEGNPTMTQFKYQEEFAAQLTKEWIAGDYTGVRTKIRNLKNKAQAAYIAARVTLNLQEIRKRPVVHTLDAICDLTPTRFGQLA